MRDHDPAASDAERHHAEEALRDSERKLKEAQRIAHVGHWERDLETGLVTASDELYRIFGVSPQRLLSRGSLRPVHPISLGRGSKQGARRGRSGP